ncbi:MAG: hypothetical protein ACPL5F_04980 [Moorellaceae bacterium]
MLVEILKGKDLYQEGEIVDFADDVAQYLIKERIVRAVTCPDCGAQMEANCCAIYCPDCGYRRWKE